MADGTIPIDAKLGANELAAASDPKGCLPYTGNGKGMESALLDAQTLELGKLGWTGENCKPTQIEQGNVRAESGRAESRASGHHR